MSIDLRNYVFRVTQLEEYSAECRLQIHKWEAQHCRTVQGLYLCSFRTADCIVQIWFDHFVFLWEGDRQRWGDESGEIEKSSSQEVDF